MPDAIDLSELFISAMPATDENCAIWATIWVLSTGLNGSCVVICVVSSFRNAA